VEPRLLHKLNAHHEISVKETSGMLPICPDAADYRREMYHSVGFRFFQQPYDVAFFGQIIIPVPGHKNGLAACIAQLSYNILSQKTGATCDYDLF